MSTKTRKKVQCDCKLCNGKLVRERTRREHAGIESRLASSIPGFEPANNLSISNTFISNSNAILDQHDVMELMEIDDPIIESSRKDVNLIEQKESKNSSDSDNHEPAFVDFVVQEKRKRQDQFRKTEVILDNQHDEISSDGEDSDEDDSPVEDDILFLSDDEILVEQFTTPDFDDDSETEYPDTNINFTDSWILI